MLRNGRYYSLLIGSFAAFEILLNAAIRHGYDLPVRNPVNSDQWVVRQEMLNKQEWRDFSRRPDVIIALSFFFVVSGATTVLPSDFNTASNTISAVGSSGPGAGANFGNNNGGGGGGGGAFSSIVNYSGHSAGQTVNVQVGTSDTWFDSTAVLLAKAGTAASGPTAGVGGAAASGVGTTKFSGGNGGTGGAGIFCGCSTDFGTGAGAGGAAGPHGAGNNGANGASHVLNNTNGVTGGSGDAGNTAGGAGGSPNGGPGANGVQFDASHGSGGGGGGGAAIIIGSTGGNGGAGGSYGGGGGGGGAGFSAAGNGGNAFQGLIAIAYTPVSSATSGAFGFFIS